MTRDADVSVGTVLVAREDWPALRTLLRTRFRHPDMIWRVGSYWVDAGLLDDARTAILANPQINYEGQLALAEGRVDQAERLLALALTRARGFGNASRSRIVRKLAEARLRAGDIDGAVTLLEGELARRARTISGPSAGYEWLLAREKLGEVYRAAGRHTDAEAINAELRTLLAVADEDHPILRRLQ
jgi:hypothetical protein